LLIIIKIKFEGDLQSHNEAEDDVHHATGRPLWQLQHLGNVMKQNEMFNGRQ